MMCFGMIWPLPPTNGTYQPPVGSLKVIFTVFGSTACTDSMLAYVPDVTAEDSLLEMNSNVNATSSAENAWPSAHLMPGFSLYVTDLPSGLRPPFWALGISAASTGANLPSPSTVISGSVQQRAAM